MTLSEWLQLVEVVIASVGFTVAIWQLWRTATAVQRTEKRVQMNDLLYQLPQLHRLEQDLDEAAASGDLDRTIRFLNEWRRQASSVMALLPERDDAQQLLGELQTSIERAGRAKNALVEGKTSPLAVTAQTRQSIERVCRQLPKVAAGLRSRSGDEVERAKS